MLRHSLYQAGAHRYIALVLFALLALFLVGCNSPQPLPVAPTPIPTLPPATLPPAVEPTEETVVGGSYPIWRYLYVYVNPALDKGEVAAYLNWIRGDEAQRIVKDVGYYPLPDKLRHK